MFIRFVSGEVDERSHVSAGLFCAAFDLIYEGNLPDYELEALTELRDWFNTHLASPFDHLPSDRRYKRGVFWFKPTARLHIARAWELAIILERHDVLIWTIKTIRTGYVHYEDDVQVFASPYADVRLLIERRLRQ